MCKKKIIRQCPACGSELSITKLSCKSCNLEISGDFDVSALSELSADEIDFVKLFLKNEGNFTKMQNDLSESYGVVKSKLNGINVKLKQKMAMEEVDMEAVSKKLSNSTDSKIIDTLKRKLVGCGGTAQMAMLRGDPISIWLSENGDGIIAEGLKNVVLEWKVFDAIITKANELGGTMMRGDSAAHSGLRIGTENFPIETIDAFVAINFFNANEGDTTLRRSTYFSGILAWAGIVENHRSKGEGGYVTVCSEYRTI